MFLMEFQTSKRFLRLTRDSISLDRGNGIFGLLPESWEKSSITNCEDPPPLEMREMVAISAFIPDKPDGSDPCNDKLVIHYVTIQLRNSHKTWFEDEEEFGFCLENWTLICLPKK